MTTIQEVARAAGVSAATVSRVFNGRPVSEERAASVRRAAAELDFTPDRTARTLRRRSSELIALVIPDIENPFFTALARGVEDAASAAGFSVVLCNTDEDHDKEARYLRIAVSENMAGVILAAAGDASDVSALLARDRHVVAVDRPPGQAVDSVLVDDAAGASAAVAALVARGFRRIACITGPSDVETAERRLHAWRQLVGLAGEDPALVAHTDFRVASAYEAATRMLTSEAPPDAVFAANNLIGVGVLRAAADAAVPVAGEPGAGIGLAVFGELPYSTTPPPGAVVVRTPARELGERAATLLLDRIRGDAEPPRRVVLEPELIDRGLGGGASRTGVVSVSG